MHSLDIFKAKIPQLLILSQPQIPEAAATSPVGSLMVDKSWGQMIAAFCMGSCISIALQFIDNGDNKTPPLTIYFVSVAILFAFTSFSVSKLLPSNLAAGAALLDKLGVFFGTTAFFMAITVPFPLCLICLTWTVYAISILIILISNLFYA